MQVSRRELLKGLGSAVIVVGSPMSGVFGGRALAQVMPSQALNFTITDALKDMVTHNSINNGQCYFWVFKEARFPADAPGPIVLTTFGETINITVTNALDEPHAFFIPGMLDTGPIAPGATFTGSFMASKTGSFLYYDNLNAPVNRVMGLHGALIVMPRERAGAGHAFTPYQVPTPAVQQLFNDLGTTPWWPGLPWERGDAATDTVPFRQYVWLTHQASPRLFQEVGSLPPGVIYNAEAFVNAFTRDPFSPTRANRTPDFFTINGQSGHFSHNNPFICPMCRVGEPVLVRSLNAGLWTHSMHIHANHVYVIGVDGAPQKNPLWVDTYSSPPMSTYEWLVPYMRPPDIPNARGIGRADVGLATLAGGKTWPPQEELDTFIPAPGERMASDAAGNPIDLKVPLTPLCFPMHDHSEPSQTAQGGNYNCGLICGLNFIGDRNTPGGVTSFPNEMFEGWPELHGCQMTVDAAPPPGAMPE
jgi:hypothetical protein